MGNKGTAKKPSLYSLIDTSSDIFPISIPIPLSSLTQPSCSPSTSDMILSPREDTISPDNVSTASQPSVDESCLSQDLCVHMNEEQHDLPAPLPQAFHKQSTPAQSPSPSATRHKPGTKKKTPDQTIVINTQQIVEEVKKLFARLENLDTARDIFEINSILYQINIATKCFEINTEKENDGFRNRRCKHEMIVNAPPLLSTALASPSASPCALSLHPLTLENCYYKRCYVKNSYVPFIEDQTHEFKGNF